MKLRRAFTLIELLVVIAIIALITSVVLAALNSARAKARNAARFSLVEQYRNALELAYSANGQYPQTSPDTYSCLGTDSSGGCWYNDSFHQSAGVTSALSPYISFPTPPQIPGNLSMPYQGFVYFNCPGVGACNGPAGATPATGYAIVFFIEGANQSCGLAQVYYNYSDETYCIYLNH